MTLVVAKKKGEVLSLVSDTGISLNGAQLGPDKRMPKICILNHNLAVGFSGSPDLAIRIIESAPKGDGLSYRALTDHFLDGHRNTDCDFILAFGQPLYKLALMSGGALRQNRATEWIGDKAGFEAFQQWRHNRKGPFEYIVPMLATNRQSEANHPTFEMLGTMHAVIERADVPSVFGHPVAVSNGDGHFEFRSYWVTLEEKPSFALPGGVNPLELISQIIEAQQYSFSCFTNSPGDTSQAVAFHYLRGKITYVYFGKVGEALSNCVVHKGLNVVELGDWAKEKLGVTWIGGISSRSGVPADYGLPAEQWKAFDPRHRRRQT